MRKKNSPATFLEEVADRYLYKTNKCQKLKAIQKYLSTSIDQHEGVRSQSDHSEIRDGPKKTSGGTIAYLICIWERRLQPFSERCAM